MRATVFLFLTAMMVAGCKTTYSWTSAVPADRRTISVPVFRNESDVTALGGTVSRQILREFQREGTFRLASAEAAAVEVQGVIRSAKSSYQGGARQVANRVNDYRFILQAEVSVVDRISGKVLVDNRVYTAETIFAGTQDLMTGRRDASGRLAEDLARQIVDDVLACQW
jgi:hypothetical protein